MHPYKKKKSVNKKNVTSHFSFLMVHVFFLHRKRVAPRFRFFLCNQHHHRRHVSTDMGGQSHRTKLKARVMAGPAAQRAVELSASGASARAIASGSNKGESLILLLLLLLLLAQPLPPGREAAGREAGRRAGR
jgi:hypothetical protein